MKVIYLSFTELYDTSVLSISLVKQSDFVYYDFQ